MNKALFVHHDTRVLDRLSTESQKKALYTTSMVQALQWITNPEIHLSGVFLSPDDATFSALRFLEITLGHRPALPIFLFETYLSAHQEQAKKIMQNTHVRGVFSGLESYQTLVSSLKENVDIHTETRSKTDTAIPVKGYLPLPISDFFTGTHFIHDVFVLDEKKQLTLFAQRNSEIDGMYLTQASFQVDFLYIRESDIREKTDDIQAIKDVVPQSPLPASWKSAEILSNTKQVLNEMKSAGVNEQLIEYTQNMLGDLFKIISNIDADEGSISTIIDQAKKCDRSVFCASYSILLCK